MAEGRKKSRAGARSVVVVEGLRTPFTRAGGPLARVHASELGRIPMEETLLRRDVPAAEVDEVIFGNVAQPADSANIARVIALRAGIPVSAPALTVHRNCASGMEARGNLLLCKRSLESFRGNEKNRFTLCSYCFTNG